MRYAAAVAVSSRSTGTGYPFTCSNTVPHHYDDPDDFRPQFVHVLHWLRERRQLRTGLSGEVHRELSMCSVPQIYKGVDHSQQ